MDRSTAAHLDATQITAGAQAAAAHVQAAAARLTEWDIIPFTGELQAIELSAPVFPEPARGGVEQADCRMCATPDTSYLWSDEHWRVRPRIDPSMAICLTSSRLIWAG